MEASRRTQYDFVRVRRGRLKVSQTHSVSAPLFAKVPGSHLRVVYSADHHNTATASRTNKSDVISTYAELTNLFKATLLD